MNTASVKYDIKKGAAVIETVAISPDSLDETIKLGISAIEKLTTTEKEMLLAVEDNEFEQWIHDNKAMLTIYSGSVRDAIEYANITLDTMTKLRVVPKDQMFVATHLTPAIKRGILYGMFLISTRHIVRHK